MRARILNSFCIVSVRLCLAAYGAFLVADATGQSAGEPPLASPDEEIKEEAEGRVGETGEISESSAAPIDEGSEVPVDESAVLAPEVGGAMPGSDWEPSPGEPDLFRELDLEDDASEEGGETPPSSIVSPDRFDTGVLVRELLPGGRAASLERQGLRFGVDVQGGYDSNLFLDETDEASDFSVVIAPSVEFRSAPEGVRGQVTAQFTPLIRTYLDETDLNTIDYTGGFGVSYAGIKGSFLASVNIASISNADRLASGRVDTESIDGSLSGTYFVTPRMSLDADLRASYREDDQSSVSKNETYLLQLTGFWRASPKLNIGPTVRYTERMSASTGDRDAFAILAAAEYSPEDSLSLNVGIGIENVDDSSMRDDELEPTGNIGLRYRRNDRFELDAFLSYAAINQRSEATFGRAGGGDSSWTGRLGFGYSPNTRWKYRGALGFSTDPSSSSLNVSIDDFKVSAIATRLLSNGSISFRGTLGQSSFNATGLTADFRDEESYYLLGFGYSRSVISERAELTSSLQWSQNSGESDWDRFQAGLGLKVSF